MQPRVTRDRRNNVRLCGGGGRSDEDAAAVAAVAVAVAALRTVNTVLFPASLQHRNDGPTLERATVGTKAEKRRRIRRCDARRRRFMIDARRRM